MPELDDILPLLPDTDPDWHEEFPPEHPAHHRGIIHRQDGDGKCTPVANTRPAEPWTNTFATHPWMSRRNALELFGLKTDYPIVSRSGVPPGGHTSWRWWNVYLSHPTLYCGKTLALLGMLDDPEIDTETGAVSVRVTRKCWHCATHGYSYRKCKAFGAKFSSKGDTKASRVILPKTVAEREQFLRYCFLREFIPLNRMRLVGQLLEVPRATSGWDTVQMRSILQGGADNLSLSSDDEPSDQRVDTGPAGPPGESQAADSRSLVISALVDNSLPAQASSAVGGVGDSLISPASFETPQQVDHAGASCATTSRSESRLEVRSEVDTPSRSARSIASTVAVARYEKVITLLMQRVSDLRKTLQAGAPTLDSTDPIDQGLAVPDAWLDMTYQSRILARHAAGGPDIKPYISRSMSKKRQLSEDSIELVTASLRIAFHAITDGIGCSIIQALDPVIRA